MHLLTLVYRQPPTVLSSPGYESHTIEDDEAVALRFRNDDPPTELLQFLTSSNVYIEVPRDAIYKLIISPVQEQTDTSTGTFPDTTWDDL